MFQEKCREALYIMIVPFKQINYYYQKKSSTTFAIRVNVNSKMRSLKQKKIILYIKRIKLRQRSYDKGCSELFKHANKSENVKVILD